MRIRFFGNLVKIFPISIIITSIFLTGIFVVLSQGMERRVDLEHYMPDSEEIEAQNYISKVFSTSDVESLQVVIIGDVLNNTVLLKLNEFNKNLSRDSKIAGTLSHVDLIINAYVVHSILQNFSQKSENFINYTINFTQFIELLKIISNITDNYNRSKYTEVRFCADTLLSAFVELHNMTIFQNESLNETFILPQLSDNMYDRAQDAIYFSNQLEWSRITAEAAFNMISNFSFYSSDLENWSKVRYYLLNNDSSSAKKILLNIRNSTAQNLTFLRLGWRYLFGPYNISLTMLYENLSGVISSDSSINYTYQNTSRNIELAENLNLSMVAYMLGKYKENLTLLWKSLNESSIEKYQIRTVQYQTIYLIQNYTMKVEEIMKKLEMDVRKIDKILNYLENSSISTAISLVDEKISEIKIQMEITNTTITYIDFMIEILSLDFFKYFQNGLRNYYAVITGNYSNQEKVYVDNMLLNIFEFINISLQKKLSSTLYDQSTMQFSNIEFPTIYDSTEILKNVSIEKLILSLERLNVSYYTELINKLTEKLLHFRDNLSYINSLLINISSVLKETEVYVRPAFTIYELERIKVEESIYTIKTVVGYMPMLNNLVYRSRDIVQGIKDMLSKDFNYKKASAAILIINIYWKRVNNSEEEMVFYQRKILRELSEALREYRIVVKGISFSLISADIEPLLNEVSNVIVPFAIILVVVFLFIVFSSVIDTILVLMGVGLSIIWMNGTAALLKIPQDQMTIVPAAIIVGLGVDYGIHVVMRYRERLRDGYNPREAAARSVESVGTALALSLITTAIAFLSNLSSPIPSVQNFGIMCALGIIYSYIIMNLLLPSIKLLLDERRKPKSQKAFRSSKAIDTAMEKIAYVSEKYYYVVLALVLMIVVAGIYSSSKIPVSFRMEDFLPEGYPTTETLNYIDKNFNVSTTSTALVLYRGNITAETLKEIDRFMNELRDNKYVIYTQSDSIVNYIRNWMVYNSTFRNICEDKDGDLLPDTNVSTALYWLYSNDQINASKYYPITLNSTIVSIRVVAKTTEEIEILYRELKEDSKVISSGKIIITGTPILTYVIVNGLQESMLSSLLVTLITSIVVLFVVFMLILRSKILGIITSVPVVIVIALIYITMFIMGYSFNVLTVTVLALTIGMGIDYSIHISHRFLDEYVSERLEYREASLKAVRHTGTALLASALTTIIGFASLMLSSMPPLRIFGLLSSLTISYSLIMALIVLPSLLILWAKSCERGGKCTFRSHLLRE